jgi:transcriptional regulator of acetoin/glycerol metabolism
MVADGLRFTETAQELISGRFALDAARLDASGGSAVVVVRTRDLRAFLAAQGPKGRAPRLETQHEGKTLARYFRGDDSVALQGKYSEPGRVRLALAKYFAATASKAVHFLGVSDEIFAALAGDVGELPASPEDEFRGGSEAATKIRAQIRTAATDPRFADTPVLILGPTGAGKEIVAKAIHRLGRGAHGGKLFAVNCAAFPGELLEAELFGVEPGTATGVEGRTGHWEEASRAGGTLFLNEVG